MTRSDGNAQAGQPLYKGPAFIGSVLLDHNTFRSALHLPSLVWSADLASDTLVWATKLARVDKGQHDPNVRGKEGENIWWGSAGAFSRGDMVDFGGSERDQFVYGVFSECQTSNSAIARHYTQVTWKDAQAVGCVLASNGKMDYLVCRYSAPGNIIGEKPH